MYGTYHASNKGSCSWYKFAKKIFEFKDIEIEVKPTTAEKFGSPAARPTILLWTILLCKSEYLSDA
ncbi:MAG: sugar nucleotide-binding protein [Halanaerobiales bacterium]|nr:sugar nucleotide-binding protein [Halanaerobiales bacterium]